MAIRLKTFTGAMLSVAAIMAVGSTAALAQTSRPYQTVPEGFNEAFFGNSRDFFGSRSIDQQFARMFGIGGFAEQRISADTLAVTQAYSNHMALQSTLDPTIRVPDLNNPYSTSLLLMPSEQTGSRILGTEFIYETLPTP